MRSATAPARSTSWLRRSSEMAGVLRTGLAFAFLAFALPAGAQDDAQVDAIIARTKNTRATYAAYYWNWITAPGQLPVQEWSAEFNDGSRHRVETPGDRIIANCAERTGTALFADGRKVTGPNVAGAACGINTNLSFFSKAYLGQVKTRFGMADHVRVTDLTNTRTYLVSQDGIIITSTVAERTGNGRMLLRLETMALKRSLPRPDIFSEASLAASVVPPARQKAPRGATAR